MQDALEEDAHVTLGPPHTFPTTLNLFTLAQPPSHEPLVASNTTPANDNRTWTAAPSYHL